MSSRNRVTDAMPILKCTCSWEPKVMDECEALKTLDVPGSRDSARLGYKVFVRAARGQGAKLQAAIMAYTFPLSTHSAFIQCSLGY